MVSDVADLEHHGDGAPRRSRRAMRQAEREAEREALLTGQQPLLTRREMRRLREEAQALQAAVAAGEITPEQAKALQNPLAVQPVIDVASLSAAGSHAAPVAGTEDDAAAEPVAAAASEDQGAGEEESASAVEPDGSEGGEEPQEAAEEAASEPEGEPASAEETADQQPEAAEPAAEEDSAAEPEQEMPEAPAEEQDEHARQAADESLNESEVEAISAVETGEMPSVIEPADAEPEEQALATVPERKPLAERLPAAGSAFSKDPTETSSAVDAPVEGERPFGAQNIFDGPAEPKGPSTADMIIPFDEKAEPGSHASAEEPEAEDGAAGETGAEQAASPTPAAGVVRRPIVRIPTATQGVRTVDSSTGELSAVQPIDEEFAGIENPQWRALHATTEGTAATEQAALVASGTDAAGDGAEASGTDRAAEATRAVEHHGHSAEPEASGKARSLAVLLLIVVVLLVVVVLVWFLVLRDGGASALTPIESVLDSLRL